MSDLISRRAAIDFIKNHSYPVRYDGNSIEQGMTVTGIEQALNEMPSIQPNQKTGRWEQDGGHFVPSLTMDIIIYIIEKIHFTALYCRNIISNFNLKRGR